MYGISAALPSARAAVKAFSIVAADAVPGSCEGAPPRATRLVPEEAPLKDGSGIEPGQLGGHLVHVLVAAAAEDEDVITVPVTALAKQPGDRVRRLERRDDPLQPGQLTEGPQRLGVGRRFVPRPPRIAQEGVLRADAGVIEAGR